MRNVLVCLVLASTLTACQHAVTDAIGGDAVMLVNVSSASPIQGTQWTMGATSVAANLISPAQSVTATFTSTSSHCLVFEGVQSWSSLVGGSPVTLSSSLQDAQAVLNGDSYAFSGLVGGRAFAAQNDNLVVSFPDANGSTVIVTVPAPPDIVDASNHLGVPAGLATTFSAADGQFDVVTVFATATAPAAGDSGVMCEYPASEMTLDGSNRVIELIDAVTRDELMARSWQVGAIFVAYHNQEIDTELFRGVEVPIIAGQMLQLNAADL